MLLVIVLAQQKKGKVAQKRMWQVMEGGVGSLRRIRYVESSGHKGRKGREREANDENVKHDGQLEHFSGVLGKNHVWRV